MSIQHVNHVIENSKARGTALAVLIIIANHANEKGLAWPSMTRLADLSNVDIRTVKRTVLDLVSRGDLEVVGHGKNNVNHYRICTDSRDTGVTTSSGDIDVTSDTGVTSGWDTGVTTVGTLVSPKPSRTINEPSDIRLKGDIEDAFERFWEAYPKRDGPNPRKPALAKFKIACRKVDPENLIQAAEKYAAEIDQQESTERNYSRKFVAQATTWLNQARWEQYPMEDPDEVYRVMMRKHLELDVWPVQWGDVPGTPGCKVPPHILNEFGMVGVLQ
jgi:hypothetical protein